MNGSPRIILIASIGIKRIIKIRMNDKIKTRARSIFNREFKKITPQEISGLTHLL
jgi:hypothetical protein